MEHTLSTADKKRTKHRKLNQRIIYSIPLKPLTQKNLKNADDWWQKKRGTTRSDTATPSSNVTKCERESEGSQ